jgi:hypothetical protein
VKNPLNLDPEKYPFLQFAFPPPVLDVFSVFFVPSVLHVFQTGRAEDGEDKEDDGPNQKTRTKTERTHAWKLKYPAIACSALLKAVFKIKNRF